MAKHIPKLKAIEKAWANIPTKNISLEEQNKSVYQLWSYITNTLDYKTYEVRNNKHLYDEETDRSQGHSGGVSSVHDWWKEYAERLMTSDQLIHANDINNIPTNSSLRRLLNVRGFFTCYLYLYAEFQYPAFLVYILSINSKCFVG